MFGNGTFQYRHGIAVSQVVFFTMSLTFSVSFYIRRQIGWFCIGVLSMIRLVGASCMLGTIHKDSDGLWAGVFVCESLGIILIIFLLLEMLERMYVSLSNILFLSLKRHTINLTCIKMSIQKQNNTHNPPPHLHNPPTPHLDRHRRLNRRFHRRHEGTRPPTHTLQPCRHWHDRRHLSLHRGCLRVVLAPAGKVPRC